MQGSIDNIQDSATSILDKSVLSDNFQLVSSYFFQSGEINLILLVSGVSLIFILLLFFFRSREEKNEDFFYIPVKEYPEDNDLNLSTEDDSKENNSITQSHARTLGKGLLESAYQSEWHVQNTRQFIPERDESQFMESTLTIESFNPLDSIEEIRIINQFTKDQCINDFQQLVANIQLDDKQLMDEFETIYKNDKLDVFIDEFEQLLKEINCRAPELLETPENMDNLIQFQSSVQFVKLLSEMMQAGYLNRFSKTVAEFLKGVIEGQIRITAETVKRLQKVVNFYNYYCQQLKRKNYNDQKNRQYKISA